MNEIVASARADVVVSSTWRHGKTVAELQVMLEAEGFTGRVVDKTPTGAPGARRGEEIGAWLAEHAVCGYVIIDDHIDMGELRTELVLTYGPWATASRRAASHRDTPATQLLEAKGRRFKSDPAAIARHRR